MTPKAAVAENLDQFVALPNHSKLDAKKESSVVPACMNAFSKVTAEWKIEFLPSNNNFVLFKMAMSVLLLLFKKVMSKSQVGTPVKIFIIFDWFFSEALKVGSFFKISIVLSNNSWEAAFTKSKATWNAVKCKS